MGTHLISALEDYCFDQAGVIPDDSDRWLFINLLDELTTGRLAHKTLSGRLNDLEDVLDHYFWVFGVLDGAGYYATFSAHTDPVPDETRAWMKARIREIRGWPSPIERAGDIAELLGFKSVAAISIGHDGAGWNTRALYWNPFFTADIALGLVRETVRIDDAL